MVIYLTLMLACSLVIGNLVTVFIFSIKKVLSNIDIKKKIEHLLFIVVSVFGFYLFYKIQSLIVNKYLNFSSLENLKSIDLGHKIVISIIIIVAMYFIQEKNFYYFSKVRARQKPITKNVINTFAFSMIIGFFITILLCMHSVL